MKVPGNSFLTAILLPAFCLLLTSQAQASNTVCNASGCIITVDWAIDVEPTHNNHTCDYDQGGLFFADTTGSGAGKCTIRRALREAGARSDESICPGCSPILIRFTGLDASDGNADDAFYDAGSDQWLLQVSSAVTASAFTLVPQSILDVRGDVLVRGPAMDIGAGEMPKIMISTETTLEIELSHVTIENLGFMGGTGLHFKEANGVFQNNSWGLEADGLSVRFMDFAGNPDNIAGPHGVLTTNKGQNMLVQDNVFAGASTHAIEISSATSGVQLLNNLIGTRIDGTVPIVPAGFECRGFVDPFNPSVDPSEWFGGAGISAAGTGLTIEGNIIAGLQSIRSINDTPPLAIEVFGSLHTIENNVIGRDINAQTVGVCGQGIKFSVQTDTINPQNNGHLILNNVVDSSRNGFENTIGAILWTDTSSLAFLDGGTTIQGNVVVDGPDKYFQVGPNLLDAIKAFHPGVVTSVVGLDVSGESHTSNVFGDPSPCPDCIIDFYLDDSDDVQEALEYLGSTVADASGNFIFTLATPLPDGHGIRTTSTTQSDNVIPNTWTGQTSQMSEEVYGVVTDVIFKGGFEQ